MIAYFAAFRVWHSVDNLPFQEVWLVLPACAMPVCRWPACDLSTFSTGRRRQTGTGRHADRRRSVGENGTIRFSFSNTPSDTPLTQLAHMQCRRYWVERAIEDAKGEAGLDQYQVRGWTGWHHHMTMTLLAMLFLLQLQKHKMRLSARRSHACL